jgi:6-pyruvoyltetrahydropterin/6-carboxytetrahydropterin synthase
MAHWSTDPEKRAATIAKMGQRMREAWADRANNGLGSRVNGSLQADVQERISASVKERWADGTYDDRVNGMLSLTAAKHHGWTWGKTEYSDILRQHETPECRFCGVTENLNAHHVDESHDNYLLTNLLWACVPCHAWKFHYRDRKLPFVQISRRLAFEYAHVLPWHPGKCARLHGHSGHLEVFVGGRLDPNGVVMDFKDLGEAAKMAVFDRLDHRFLNDYMANPTSENLLVWAWRAL